jgi:hypothetical protein
LKLPTDKVLVEDPVFRRYVQLYAKVHANYSVGIQIETAPEQKLILLLMALFHII